MNLTYTLIVGGADLQEYELSSSALDRWIKQANELNRQFQQTEAKRVVVSDLTYVKVKKEAPSLFKEA